MAGAKVLNQLLMDGGTDDKDMDLSHLIKLAFKKSVHSLLH